MKMKYDESDNALIRASRAVTDRVTDFLGNAHSCLVLMLLIFLILKSALSERHTIQDHAVACFLWINVGIGKWGCC